MRLVNKKIIVTGGSRGIGKAIAIGIAKEGAELVITYEKNKESAIETIEQLKQFNIKAKAFQLDLQLTEKFQTFIEEATSFLGGLDVLVNNAGTATRNLFINISKEEYDKVLSTNLKGPYFLCQATANYMKNQNRGGSIINISSISDRIATQGLTHYQCSKAGLSMLSKGIALELAEYGIRVNTIAPGLVATDLNRDHWEHASKVWLKRSSEIPLGRSGEPEDIAGAAILFASDEAKWITGACLVVDGGRAIF